MSKYEIDMKALIYIDDTSSQLETALHASNLLAPKEFDRSVAFANIDTVLFDRGSFFNSLENCCSEDGVIDTFVAENKNYSYARINDSQMVVDVADNSIISSDACSGLYGFGSYNLMAKETSYLLRENPDSNFTALYKYWISKGKKVYAHISKGLRNTIVLGTPEEYVTNIHKFK